MRLLLLAVLLVIALLLFLLVDLGERAVEPTPAVRTSQEWPGRWQLTSPAVMPAPVVARARTAPSERTVHALSVTAGAAESVAVIRDVFARFGPEVVDEAIRVSACETGGTFDPTVVNSSGHTGLFQLSPTYHTGRAARLGFTWAQMREARPNATVAADLFGETRTWHAWTCRWAA